MINDYFWKVQHLDAARLQFLGLYAFTNVLIRLIQDGKKVSFSEINVGCVHMFTCVMK